MSNTRTGFKVIDELPDGYDQARLINYDDDIFCYAVDSSFKKPSLYKKVSPTVDQEWSKVTFSASAAAYQSLNKEE